MVYTGDMLQRASWVVSSERKGLRYSWGEVAEEGGGGGKSGRFSKVVLVS